MRTTIRCDACDFVFESTLKEIHLQDGGIRVCFDCPRCGTLYPVARLTARGVEIRNQIQTTTDRVKLYRLRRSMKGEVVDERSGG